MIKVGVIGSTGYAGQQLVWLLNNHKNVEIVFLSSHSYANKAYTKVYPQYRQFNENICIDMESALSKLDDIDLLFLALPHGKTFEITKKAIDKNVRVIDLSADLRLKSQSEYEKWYKLRHKLPKEIKNAVYGLCELNREKIKTTKLLANPGCYPTASILSLAPLVFNKLIEPSSIIIDAKSGVSGAGRKANLSTLYGECNESLKAYKVSSHRHTPEIEQELSKFTDKDITLSFTPHLVPMNRGILATSYAKLTKKVNEEDIFNLYNKFYKDEYFIRIIKDLPETRFVKGTNICDISLRVDIRTKRVIIVSAIDNLIKGAAGQAVQNMNIMFDFNENEGLNLLSMLP
ncbi:MAG: N-acetyl-gamma-glutamyl-phosphate reductase [Firmicutes bacterium]|nr:N-acetyl-gamma-glutamyl-phosphate reductase [Bacillota bacterium]